MKNKFQVDESLIRSDGKVALSPAGRALADKRMAATDGKIDRVLAEGNEFSISFKEAIRNDHLQILERLHLDKELKATKRIITALKKVPNDRAAKRLLRKMRVDPVKRKGANVLCPVWRHWHELQTTFVAANRYLFQRVRGEIYLLTIVFDHAENLEILEEKYRHAQLDLKEIVAEMTKKRRGVFMVGSFEPDLHSYEDFQELPKLHRMMKDFGYEAAPTGGWVLTGHFIVRAPHVDDLKSILRQRLPAKGWARVQFDQVYKNRSLQLHIMQILGYASKRPKPLFDPPTRGEEKKQADERMGRMSAAFYGPNFNHDASMNSLFDLDSAIRQWAMFMDRIGEHGVYYSVESALAQKWYSESELDFIRARDEDLFADGSSLIEMHRDKGPLGTNDTLVHIKGKMRRLRSRRMKQDDDWMDVTDLCDIPGSARLYHQEHWIVHPQYRG